MLDALKLYYAQNYAGIIRQGLTQRQVTSQEMGRLCSKICQLCSKKCQLCAMLIKSYLSPGNSRSRTLLIGMTVRIGRTARLLCAVAISSWQILSDRLFPALCGARVHVNSPVAMEWMVRRLYFLVVRSLCLWEDRNTGFRFHLGDTLSHTGSQVTYKYIPLGV